MIKMLSLTLVLVLSCALTAVAHHPTEEMLDPELFEMIDEMVSDVHSEMVFDDTGVGTIENITVEDADDLIQDGFLDAAAALDGDVTITIEIQGADTGGAPSRLLSIEELSDGYGTKANQDAYQNLWDQPVVITFEREELD